MWAPSTSFLLKGRENGKTRGHMEEGEIGRDKEKRERERGWYEEQEAECAGGEVEKEKEP